MPFQPFESTLWFSSFSLHRIHVTGCSAVGLSCHCPREPVAVLSRLALAFRCHFSLGARCSARHSSSSPSSPLLSAPAPRLDSRTNLPRRSPSAKARPKRSVPASSPSSPARQTGVSGKPRAGILRCPSWPRNKPPWILGPTPSTTSTTSTTTFASLSGPASVIPCPLQHITGLLALAMRVSRYPFISHTQDGRNTPSPTILCTGRPRKCAASTLATRIPDDSFLVALAHPFPPPVGVAHRRKGQPIPVPLDPAWSRQSPYYVASHPLCHHSPWSSTISRETWATLACH
ncbi:hypothetical protein LZ30DRAFT_412129 [Colletotrichum cereale]|nr:hypothetical protein LZ30DRAFT_412129 [Colletotrichum cereale]